jgi:hypothetical protein
MTRILSGLVLGTLAVLILPASLEAGRCPFCMQAQLQMQMQWQQQAWQQQQMMARHNVSRRTNYARHTAVSRSTRQATARVNRTTVHRSTTTHLRTLTTRRISTQTRTTVRHHTLHGPGRHPGRPAVDVSRTRTHTSQTRLHLQRVTESHLHTTRHTSLTQRRLTTTRHTPLQRRVASIKPRSTRKAESNNRRGERHTPSVQLRVRLSGTCGTCHQCKQNQPTLTSLPQRQPFQVGPRADLPGPPWRPVVPAPGLVVRLPGQPLQPLVAPRPNLNRFVLPGLQPRSIPVLDAPMLPPLGVARGSEPRRQAPELLTTLKDSNPSPGPSIGEEEARRPGTAIVTSPPPLPMLQGSVVQLAPLLAGQKQDTEARPARVYHADLQPAVVIQAPRLTALPGLPPLRQGLLPNLDADDSGDEGTVDPSRRPTLVELTLRPPPLPPLPETASP